MGFLTKAAQAVEGVVAEGVSRGEKALNALIGKELPASVATEVEKVADAAVEVVAQVADTEINAEVAKLDPATPAATAAPATK